MAIAIIYRWRIHAGQEIQFATAWRTVTNAIVSDCGSHGSCLHQDIDGIFVAYARWQSEAERQACFTTQLAASANNADVANARAIMRAAIVESMPEQLLTVYDDASTFSRG